MPKKGLVYRFLALLVVFLIFLILMKLSKPADLKYCEIDGDCVPATCCHPSGLVNMKYAPDCRGMICTEVCEGPLDCGKGEIRCLNKECTIKPG